MTMAELLLIVAAINQNDDLMDLNDGGFPSDARADLLFGISSMLFFNSEGDPAKNEATVRMAEQHFRDCGGSVAQLVQESDARRLKSVEDIRRVLASGRADDPTVDDLREQLSGRKRTLSFYIRGANAAADRVAPVHDTFSCLVDGQEYRGGGSLIRYDRPIEAVVTDAAGFVRSFVERCEAVGAFHAVSGLALLFSTYSSSVPMRAFPVFQRFPGLLYADAGRFNAARKRRDDVVLDVNWLTAISQPMLERLGGEAAASGALGPEVTRHQFDGGVVFQAGALPRFGDTNMGDIPTAYRQVARFLKPLRFDGWTRPFLLRAPDGLDAAETTAAWVGRFD